MRLPSARIRSLQPGQITALDALLLRVAIRDRKSKLEHSYLRVIRIEKRLKQTLEIHRGERNAYVDLLTKLHRYLALKSSHPTTKNPTPSSEALSEIDDLTRLRASMLATGMHVTCCYAELHEANAAALQEKHALNRLTALSAETYFIGEARSQLFNS